MSEFNTDVLIAQTIVPDNEKNLRACLRCARVKSFEDFHAQGCENCGFLKMDGNVTRINECTSSYWTGLMAVMHPESSWACEWQSVSQFRPGIYAMEVKGSLPKDFEDQLLENDIIIIAKP